MTRCPRLDSAAVAQVRRQVGPDGGLSLSPEVVIVLFESGSPVSAPDLAGGAVPTGSDRRRCRNGGACGRTPDQRDIEETD